MTRFKSALCAALAMSFAAGTFMPAQAAPLPSVAQRVLQDAKTSDVTNVQYRDREGYYRGHRGYRTKRPGYRYRNGYWFPAAAFITGAIVGGAIANDRHVTRMSDRHVRWCTNQYRSYRASDNTYNAGGGVRRACNSPYN
jgi:hypothetical protein